MGIKINQYALERITFGDDDYYDIDYFDGANYQTAKIKGSTIKAGIQAGITLDNLYSIDGVLTANRTVDGGLFNLEFNNLGKLVIVSDQLGVDNVVFKINNNVSNSGLDIQDSVTTNSIFKVINGEVKINNAYVLPTTDGTVNQVLTTDGAGITSWVTPTPASSDNIYNIDGTLSANRILDGGLFNLTLNNLGKIEFISDQLGVDNVVFQINNNASNSGFDIIDTVTSNSILMIRNGEVRINDDYSLPITDGLINQVLSTDGAGQVSWQNQVSTDAVNISSTQWSKTLASPESLPDGGYANGFTFFTNADKVLGGTTSYNEFNIQFGIEIELSGTGGSALISINGTSYSLIFATDLNTTALNFVTTNETALNLDNVRVFNIDADANSPFGNKNARLRFCTTELIANGITIVNTLGTLDGVISNPFTGLSVSSPDHCLVPYVGEPYAGQRLHHTFRVNFGIGLGNVQTMALSLRRYENDSIIASEIQVIRSNDEEGQQHTFASYTAGATDPFVLGGFYFALRNDSGSASTIVSGLGILVQNDFQKPTNF